MLNILFTPTLIYAQHLCNGICTKYQARLNHRSSYYAPYAGIPKHSSEKTADLLDKSVGGGIWAGPWLSH